MNVTILNERFNSNFGEITATGYPFCKGCSRFYPRSDIFLAMDEEGNVIRDEYGNSVHGGITIRCEHFHVCNWVAREVRDHISKEESK